MSTAPRTHCAPSVSDLAAHWRLRKMVDYMHANDLNDAMVHAWIKQQKT